MNVEHFLPLDRFRSIAGRIVRELRELQSNQRIYTAGEKAHDSEMRIRKEGVKIPPGLQNALNFLRAELNITGHDLGF